MDVCASASGFSWKKGFLLLFEGAGSRFWDFLCLSCSCWRWAIDRFFFLNNFILDLVLNFSRFEIIFDFFVCG